MSFLPAAWRLFLPLMCAALPALAAEPRLSAPQEVRGLLARYLELGNLAEGDDTDAHTSRLALLRRLERDTRELLTTEGYFSPTVSLLDENGDGGPPVLRVDPGPRTTVTSVNIEIRGDIDPARRSALLAAWPLAVGEPLRQVVWEEGKQALLRDLVASDFAAARLTHSRAEVDPEARSADLQLVYETGLPYRYGTLEITGLKRYDYTLVNRYNRSIFLGADYSEESLLDFQAALQQTPYFASVSVDVERELFGEAESEGAERLPVVSSHIITPVRVRLRERPPHQISLGGGVSSNTGARVEAAYRSADLFHRAWELNTGARIEQRRQAAYADIFLPPEGNTRDSFGTVVENSKISGLGLQRFAVGAVRSETRGSIEQRLGVNWQQEKQSPDNAEERTNRALTGLASWTWRRAKDPLDLSEGISAQFQIGGGSKWLLSDQNFLRFYARYHHGFPLGPNASLLLRGELGMTVAPSREGIPQDFLFRAGGSNSVRGYAYQSLGVKEGTAIVGGRYLATMSAEYTYWLDPKWGVATFVDAGQAADDRRGLRDLSVGYGLGARWRSPAGPLAVDVARGHDDGKVRLHFSLAIPF